MATQEELRQHLIKNWGWTEEEIGNREIPQAVLSIHLDKRFLTEAEEEHARTLKPTLGI